MLFDCVCAWFTDDNNIHDALHWSIKGKVGLEALARLLPMSAFRYCS